MGFLPTRRAASDRDYRKRSPERNRADWAPRCRRTRRRRSLQVGPWSATTEAMKGTNTKLTAAVEAYFTDLRQVRASGGATGERSSCPALSNLLNAVGATLKPKVFCVVELADQCAGHADVGLYEAKQVQKGPPREGQAPERGVVEVKAAGRRRMADGGGRSGEPELEPLPTGVGDEHTRLRSAWRGRSRSAGEAGGIPAGRKRGCVRAPVGEITRLRPRDRRGPE